LPAPAPTPSLYKQPIASNSPYSYSCTPPHIKAVFSLRALRPALSFWRVTTTNPNHCAHSISTQFNCSIASSLHTPPPHTQQTHTNASGCCQCIPQNQGDQPAATSTRLPPCCDRCILLQRYHIAAGEPSWHVDTRARGSRSFSCPSVPSSLRVFSASHRLIVYYIHSSHN